MSAPQQCFIVESQSQRPSGLRGDPVRRLLEALEAMAYEGTRATLLRGTPWASGMFEGMRYEVVLIIPGPLAMSCADRLRRTLHEAEFAIGGYIVADAVVDDAYATHEAAIVTVSALVLRDA